MLLNSPIELDSSLQELVQSKPSSILKLKAAWDGLSVETQIKIFHIFQDKLPKEIIKKSLFSKNEYIRYLAVKNGNLSDKNHEDQNDIKIINEDKNCLVKYTERSSRIWSQWSKEDDSDLFFSMPHEGQVVTISSWSRPNSFVKLMKWAIENKPAEQSKLDELTKEFVHNQAILSYFKELDDDGYDAYLKGKELEELWSLVPILYATDSATLLATYLPLEAGLFSLSTEQLSSFESSAIGAVLYRTDFYCPDFRREIFLSPNNESNYLQYAAACNNLQLSDQDFHHLIKSNNKELLQLLGISNARNPYFSPIYLCLLEDMSSYYDFPTYFSKNLEEQILHVLKAEDDDESKIECLMEIVLYKIAVQAVPWVGNEATSIEFEDNLKFLQDKIVINDTWGTYISFSSAFCWHQFNTDMDVFSKKIEDLDVLVSTALYDPREILHICLNTDSVNIEGDSNLNEIESEKDRKNLDLKVNSISEDINEVIIRLQLLQKDIENTSDVLEDLTLKKINNVISKINSVSILSKWTKNTVLIFFISWIALKIV
ncbi:TPA: hypothetical protein JBD00_14455 [Legionella pneumophila subsp. pneumophila]|nr:hypothetical protein [Legionella pneumophila subsp. pneumophila]